MTSDMEATCSPPQSRCDTDAIAAWLADGARSAVQPQEVLAELCDRLVGCGIPLWRVAVFGRPLHPQVMGRRLVWRPGAEVEISEAPYELLETATYRESPITRVYQTGRAIRRKLADPHCVEDFPILAELRAEGVTDYLVSPLVFTDGAVHAVTCTTRQPGGFTDDEIAG